MNRADEIVKQAETLYADISLEEVRRWKAAHPGRLAIGMLPVYAPREVIHASGALPVAVLGGGDQIDVVKGDAHFQSYICHLPRSTVELGLAGHLDALDGFVFPSTCDVIRNLSGVWQMLFPDKYVRYLDLPQSTDDATGGEFYRADLTLLAGELAERGGRPCTTEALSRSIELYDANRGALRNLHQLRVEAPWLVPSDEAYLLLRAGAMLEVEAHTALITEYLEAAPQRPRRREDRIRVLLTGAFCEQPPLALLRILERSGCYIVDDDLFLGARWFEEPLGGSSDPMGTLALAYLRRSAPSSIQFDRKGRHGRRLVQRVQACGADGVVFAAPSFCDPALLDQPPLQKALADAQIPLISFKYAENTGQFQSIREQAGTFSDSIKLWGAA